ncbi:MAG TPA: class I SAM-dependent methyltransferase [Xanthobacteraceae bacterium]|nr:class I SAM-dependent methyltransferase [Xanthobacteraceae bacterium]
MRTFFDRIFSRKPATPTAESVISLYSQDYPSPDNAFKLFEGEWTSKVPGFPAGQIDLFSDSRIDWLVQQCGGLSGKSVLELGPLEGGHTHMLSKAGAGRILSIEANRQAFLRCLVVQAALKFDAEFLLGDFRSYLKDTEERFDFLLASGVLYHMTNPEEMLVDMARVAPRLGIWTHYFDKAVLERSPQLWEKFDHKLTLKRVGNREIRKYGQRYLKALDWKGFCGAGAMGSHWLERDDITGILEDLGFSITIAFDDPAHLNGPSFLFYAERK